MDRCMKEDGTLMEGDLANALRRFVDGTPLPMTERQRVGGNCVQRARTWTR
jgi:hypothetical protein